MRQLSGETADFYRSFQKLRLDNNRTIGSKSRKQIDFAAWGNTIMIRSARSTNRRRLSLVLGTSALASGLGMSSTAYAQCVPDPTVSNGTTTCDGVDANGLRVTTPGTTVTVSSGATVNGSAAPAITIDVPAATGPVTDVINVRGVVDGGSQSGISLLSARSGFSSVLLDLHVAAGASISGNNAVLIDRNPASGFFTDALVTIDNAGTLTGSSGVALAMGPVIGGYQSIANRQTGLIGAILAPIGTLDNAGRIDGGSNSAIDTRGTTGGTTAGPWTNSGTITSASSGGTIANMAQSTLGLSNSGTVSNTGTGPAFSGSFVYLDNQAGGIVSAAGGSAIVADLGLSLTNAGQINGDVILNTPSGYGFSGTIDSTLGRINGNVKLGAGSDTVVARYDGTPTLVTGITGTIDAGGGINAIELRSDRDVTVNTGLDLLPGFQTLRLATAQGATVTLDSGFVAPGTIELSGEGSVVNRAAISGTGTLFTAEVNQGPVASFTNSGALTTSGFIGLDLTQVGSVLNSGTITATNGIAVGLSVGGTLTNTGTITGSVGGVSSFSTAIDNQGLISSTGAYAVVIQGSSGLVLTNSGRIEGGTNGVLSSVLVSNSGTISGVTNGVRLDAYGSVINAAGGVISGANSITGSLFNTGVANAGTLNGDVVLDGSGTRYLALPGGVLNGNLTLGQGGILVTDLVNSGPGQFAGINGTVNVTDGILRYRVNSDATAVLGPSGPFQFAGYEVGSGATLTLTAPTQMSRQVVLAGSGSVVLNADLFATSGPAVTTTDSYTIPSYLLGSPSALSITNLGSITLSRPVNDFGLAAAVGLSYADSFTNLGTISVVDHNGGFNSFGIAGSSDARVINSGTIQLDGGRGVFAVGNLINNGSIVQIAGGATAIGVSDVETVDNRGTIDTAGTAVSMTGGSLVNSGTIVSRGGPAVIDAGTGGTITNLAGGTITGGSGMAVQAQGETLTNSGTIAGSVDLGFSSFGRAFESGTYVAAGGTITGDLLFGSGDDTLIVTGPTSGVSGMIDGGLGVDTVILDRTGAGSFAGATEFERLTVNSGTWTLTGSQVYSNGATIVGGRLTLAGRLIAPVTVQSGGTLGGNGTVSSLSVANGGTVAPGNSIGTIIVSGAFTQAAGSTYAAETTAAGASDLILVGGAAAIGSGATLAVARDSGSYTIGRRYTLLSASGGITGQYTLSQLASGGTEFRLGQSATSIFVDVARTGASLVGLGRTSNQRAVASGLAALNVGNAAYAALTLLPDDAAARSALADLAGGVHASQRTAALKDAQLVQDAVIDRLDSPIRPGIAVWGQLLSRQGHDDGDLGEVSTHRNTFGGAGGIDLALGESARIGVAGGATRTKLLAQRGSSARIESTHLLGYAGGDFGMLSLRAGVGYVWVNNKSARSIAFDGFAGSETAKYDGWTLHGFAEVGDNLPLWGGKVTPFARFEAYRVHSDAFAETGSTAAALTGAARTQDFSFSLVGVKLATPITEGLRAHARLGWQHGFNDLRPDTLMRFSAGTVPFDILGAPLSKDSAAVTIDLAWQPRPNLTITSGYSGWIGGQSDDSSVHIAIAIGF
jgi:outer membrane autotransporter protein